METRNCKRSSEKIIKYKAVSLKPKATIINTIVFPVIVFGCESWTWEKADKKNIDSF